MANGDIVGEYDVIIIGAGPAGMAAAIYTTRRNLKTLILSSDLGGQVMFSPHIENYPGLMQVSGVELMNNMEEQVKKSGAEIIYETVFKIEEKKEDGKLKFVLSAGGTDDAKEFKRYVAKALILAFGKSPRKLDAAGEKEFAGKGISYCANCDGPLFKGKPVAVIGGGNSALDAAHMMSDIASKVYLIHRRKEFRAFESIINSIKSKENVEMVLDSVVKEFRGDKFLKSITVENTGSKETKELEVAGAFVEIGSEVKTELVKDLVKLGKSNQIEINNRCETFEPNDSSKVRPGIFAAGDVATTPFKQIIVATGEGAKAALQAYNYIHGIGNNHMNADWGK